MSDTPEMPKLMQLLAAAKARVSAMTEAEYEVMIAAQRASWVSSEMMWPKPKFKFVNGTKVYDSYEDYCS